MLHKLLMLPLAVLIGLSAVGSARASTELREKLTAAAKQILQNTQKQPVSVDQFTPTQLALTNSGPGIQEELKTALEKEQPGSVQAKAKYAVKGDYALAVSKLTANLKEIKITVRIIDADSQDELTQLRVQLTLDENKSLAEVLQVTASLDPNGKKAERNAEIIKKAENPTVHIHGARDELVSSNEKSPYDVEVRVKPLKDHEKKVAEPREAKDVKGEAFIEIKRDELYEIVIHNRSPKEVAVSISIDGIDMFHFSDDKDPATGKPKFTNFIVPGAGTPGNELTIVGWHKSVSGKENFLSFKVTAYGEGASSKAGVTAQGKLGTIHVQFANCTPLPEGAKPRSGNETGFGPPREVKQKIVSYEIEPPHDFVTIRYDR